MAYTIAGIDVHKRMLAVVVADLTADGEYAFERRQLGSTPPSWACWPTGSASMRSMKPSWNPAQYWKES
jgi:hypothetical protein